MADETAYIRDEFKEPYSIGMKLRLRVACARLIGKAAMLGVSDPVIDRWRATIHTDKFADVRRELPD